MPENQNNTPDWRIPARQAAERYLSHRREEVAQKTVQGQSTPVKRFAKWCDQSNKSIHQLNGFDLQDFYDHLKEDGYKKVTLQNYMTAVRQFLRYLERLDVAPAGIADKVHLPSLQKGDRRRDEEIEPERVREIVQHLERFRYASRDHVILLILWRTGIRNGSLHSLDLQDFTELEEMLEGEQLEQAKTFVQTLIAYREQALDQFIEEQMAGKISESGRWIWLSGFQAGTDAYEEALSRSNPGYREAIEEVEDAIDSVKNETPEGDGE